MTIYWQAAIEGLDGTLFANGPERVLREAAEADAVDLWQENCPEIQNRAYGPVVQQWRRTAYGAESMGPAEEVRMP